MGRRGIAVGMGFLCLLTLGCKLTGYDPLVSGTTETVSDSGPTGNPLREFIDTPGFIVELTGNPVKFELYAYKSIGEGVGAKYQVRLLGSLGSGRGNEGHPVIAGRHFFPAVIEEEAFSKAAAGASNIGLQIKIWYDTPFGPDRTVRVLGRNGQKGLLEIPASSFANYFRYDDLVNRAPHPPNWLETDKEFWGTGINPIATSKASPMVWEAPAVAGADYANNDGASPAEQRLFVSVRGGVRSVTVFQGGKPFYSVSGIPADDTRGTYPVGLPGDFSFYLPADLSRLGDLTIEARYADSDVDAIKAGGRRIVLFNQTGQWLQEVRITKDYNPLYQEHRDYYDMNTHTAKLTVKDPRDLALNPLKPLGPLKEPLVVTAPGAVSIQEGHTDLTTLETNRPANPKSYQERVNYFLPVNPGALFQMKTDPESGIDSLCFKSPVTYHPEGNNEYEVGVFTYDCWGYTDWRLLKVAVKPHPDRALPKVGILEREMKIDEPDNEAGIPRRNAFPEGSPGTETATYTVRFSKKLGAAARIPLELPGVNGDYTVVSGIEDLENGIGYLAFAKDDIEKTFTVRSLGDEKWIESREEFTIRVKSPSDSEKDIWRLPFASETNHATTKLYVYDNDLPKIVLMNENEGKNLYRIQTGPDYDDGISGPEYREKGLLNGSVTYFTPNAFGGHDIVFPHRITASLDPENRENGGVNSLPKDFSITFLVGPDGKRDLFAKDGNSVHRLFYDSPLKGTDSSYAMTVRETVEGDGKVRSQVVYYENKGTYRKDTSNGKVVLQIYMNDIDNDEEFAIELGSEDHYRIGDGGPVILKAVNVD